MISLYDYENSLDKKIRFERYEAEARGRAEGKAEGEAEGRAKGKAEVIAQLLAAGMPREQLEALLSA